MVSVKILGSNRNTRSFNVTHTVLLILATVAAMMVSPVLSTNIGVWNGDPDYAVSLNDVGFIGDSSGCGLDPASLEYLDMPQTGFDVQEPIVRVTPSEIYTGIHIEVETWYLPQTSRYLIDFQTRINPPTLTNLDSLLNFGGSCSNRKSRSTSSIPYPTGVPDVEWWNPSVPNTLYVNEPGFMFTGNLAVRSPWIIEAVGCTKIIYKTDISLNSLGACDYDEDHSSTVEVTTSESGDIVAQFFIAVSLVTLTNQSHANLEPPNTFSSINRISWQYPVTATFGSEVNTVSLGNTGQGSTYIQNVDVVDVGGSLNIKVMIGYTPPTGAYGGLSRSYDADGDNGVSRMFSTNPDVAYSVMGFDLLYGAQVRSTPTSILLSVWTVSSPPPGGVYDGTQTVWIGTAVCDSSTYDTVSDRELVKEECVVANVPVTFRLKYTSPVDSEVDVNLKTSFNLYSDMIGGSVLNAVNRDIVLSAGTLCFDNKVESVDVDGSMFESPKDLELTFDVSYIYLCRPNDGETEIVYKPEASRYGCIDSFYSVELYPEPSSAVSASYSPTVLTKGEISSALGVSTAVAMTHAAACFEVDPSNPNPPYPPSQPHNGRMWLHVVSVYRAPDMAKREVHHIYAPGDSPATGSKGARSNKSPPKPASAHVPSNKIKSGTTGKTGSVVPAHVKPKSHEPYPPPASTSLNRHHTSPHPSSSSKANKHYSSAQSHPNATQHKAHTAPATATATHPAPKNHKTGKGNSNNKPKSVATTADVSVVNQRDDGVQSLVIVAYVDNPSSSSHDSDENTVIVVVDYKDVKWGEWWIVLIFVFLILLSVAVCFGIVYCFSDEKERQRIKAKREHQEALRLQEEESLNKRT